MKIKTEENVIKDVDVNVVMDIKLYTNQKNSKETYIFGSKFDLNQISNSKLFVDNKEINLTNYLLDLEDNKEYNIKILLEGILSNASYMFDNTSDMEIKFSHDYNGKKRNFDKSKIKSMKNMFIQISNLTIDMSIFNSKYVENMDHMFYKSNIDTLQNISSLDTSSVLTMESMFYSTYSTKTDLSFLKENKAESMKYMFYNSYFSSLNLSSFDISKCKNMFAMFSGCKVTSFDLSSFKTNLVSNMYNMFSFMNLSYINLSSFDTSQVSDMMEMFYYFNCTKLDISSFNTNKVQIMYEMFSYANISSFDASFDLTSVRHLNKMFFNANFITMNLTLINFRSATFIKNMIQNMYAKILKLYYSFEQNQVTDMSFMFQYLNVESLDLSSFNTSQVNYMSQMFSKSQIQYIDLSNFDTEYVEDMGGIFSSCSNLVSSDLSSFKIINALSTEDMFQGCENLQYLKLWSHDEGTIVKMSYMFQRMNLESLDFKFKFNKCLSY